MLMPKRVKYRKRHKGRMRGTAYRGGSLDFGTYGLQTLECGRITNRQIEAARIAMTRYIKRGGKIWLRILLYWGRIQSISPESNWQIGNDHLCRGFYVQAFVIAGKERKNPLQSICSDTRAIG